MVNHQHKKIIMASTKHQATHNQENQHKQQSNKMDEIIKQPKLKLKA